MRTKHLCVLIHIRIKDKAGTVKSNNFSCRPFRGGASFVDFYCCFCFVFVFVILTCLFLAALCLYAGKGLASWFSCIWYFLVVLSLSHTVSWVKCGTWLYRFLLFAFFLTFITTSCEYYFTLFISSHGTLRCLIKSNYIIKTLYISSHRSLSCLFKSNYILKNIWRCCLNCLKEKHQASRKKCVLKIYFLYFSSKTYVVGTQKNRLNDMVLLSTKTYV